MAHEFSELAEEMSLTDGDGELCIVEEEEGDHGHDDEGEEFGHEGEEHGHDEGEEEHGEKFLKKSLWDKLLRVFSRFKYLPFNL